MNRDSVVDRIAVVLLFCLLAFHLLSQYPVIPAYVAYGHSDAIVPARWLRGDFEPVQGSYQYYWARHILSMVPRIEAGLAAMLNEDVLEMERWRSLIGTVMAFLGLFFAGHALNGSPAVGLISSAVLPLSWIGKNMIGYDFLIWTGRPNVGNFGMAASVLIWAVWLTARRDTRCRLAAYLLAGLLFNIHAMYAVILLAIFVLFDIYVSVIVRESDRPMLKSLRLTVVGAIGFLILSLPQLLVHVSLFGGLRANNSPDTWWRLMFAFKLHHVMPWRFLRADDGLYGVLMLVVLFGLGLYVVKPCIRQLVWRKLLLTLGAVLALVVFNVVAVEVFWSSFIASLTLSRSTFLLPIGVLVMASQLSWRYVSAPADMADSRGRLIGRSETLLLPVLLLSGPWIAKSLAALLVLSTATLRRVDIRPSIAQVIFGCTIAAFGVSLGLSAVAGGLPMAAFSVLTLCYGAVVFGALAAFRNHGDAGNPASWFGRSLDRLRSALNANGHDARSVLCCVILFLMVIMHPVMLYGVLNLWNVVASPAYRSAVESAAYFDAFRLTSWMRTATSKDALFVMPPHFRYSAGISLRSSIIDAGEIGFAIYMPARSDFELKAIRVIYDIDLLRMSWDEVKQFYWQAGCAFERRYLQGSINKVFQLKKEFPSLSYVVGVRPGVYPLMWGCGPFRGDILDLPIVFRNDTYIVYDVRKLGAEF